MFFWSHEDRCGPDGTRTVKIMPLPWATGNFVILEFRMFFLKIVRRKSYVLLSDGDSDGPSMSPSTMFCAGNAAMCSLPYVLRSEGTAAALHSSEGYVLRSQANRFCAG